MKRQDVSKTLAVVALLVATGVLISGYAMGEVGPPGPVVEPPVIIGLAAHGTPPEFGSTIFRLWDDGLIEVNRRPTLSNNSWVGWRIVPDP